MPPQSCDEGKDEDEDAQPCHAEPPDSLIDMAAQGNPHGAAEIVKENVE